jgi:hypothetical protein
MGATAIEEVEIVHQLADNQWPAEVFDDQLRLVSVSRAPKSALGGLTAGSSGVRGTRFPADACFR